MGRTEPALERRTHSAARGVVLLVSLQPCGQQVTVRGPPAGLQVGLRQELSCLTPAGELLVPGALRARPGAAVGKAASPEGLSCLPSAHLHHPQGPSSPSELAGTGLHGRELP